MQIPGLTAEHSGQFYEIMILNFLEIIDPLRNSVDFYLCLPEEDRDFVPPSLNVSDVKIIYHSGANSSEMIKFLNEKYFQNYSKKLIVRSNAIGINSAQIEKIFDLLGIDDNASLLGKTKDGRLVFCAFNSIPSEFFEQISESDVFDYNLLLRKLAEAEIYLNILEGFLLIENFDDFRNLYRELSRKESLSYCSQKIHEMFTSIFIEYKEKL
ncbi:MAG: hypothetical protein Kow0098_22980 [Ignavibacteriaceae bacterium]